MDDNQMETAYYDDTQGEFIRKSSENRRNRIWKPRKCLYSTKIPIQLTGTREME